MIVRSLEQILVDLVDQIFLLDFLLLTIVEFFMYFVQSFLSLQQKSRYHRT